MGWEEKGHSTCLLPCFDSLCTGLKKCILVQVLTAITFIYRLDIIFC